MSRIVGKEVPPKEFRWKKALVRIGRREQDQAKESCTMADDMETKGMRCLKGTMGSKHPSCHALVWIRLNSLVCFLVV